MLRSVTFAVHCHRCRAHYDGGALTQSEVLAALRQAGWRRVDELKWLCPTCARRIGLR